MGFSARIKIDSTRPRKDGTAAVFMQVIINKKKARIDLGIHWPVEFFSDGLCQSRFRKDVQAAANNEIIKTACTRANTIRKDYLVRDLHLIMDIFLHEFHSNLNKQDFIEYFEKKSLYRWNKGLITDGTYAQEKGTLKKLKAFNPQILFRDFTVDWATDFDRFLKQRFGNSVNGRWARHKHVKTYLHMASQFDNITFVNPYQRFRCPLNEGNWGPLSLEQMKNLIAWYMSNAPTPVQKIVLRRFLFACNCALRISDLQRLDRQKFSNGEMSLTPKKTARYNTQIKSAPLNDIARLLLEEELSENTTGVFNRYSDQYSNRVLKEIAKEAGMDEVSLHHHVARYTFASLYDQAGGNHTSLMKYMGLRKRSTLEKYVKTNKAVMEQDIQKMNTFMAIPS